MYDVVSALDSLTFKSGSCNICCIRVSKSFSPSKSGVIETKQSLSILRWHELDNRMPTIDSVYRAVACSISTNLAEECIVDASSAGKSQRLTQSNKATARFVDTSSITAWKRREKALRILNDALVFSVGLRASFFRRYPSGVVLSASYFRHYPSGIVLPAFYFRRYPFGVVLPALLCQRRPAGIVLLAYSEPPL